MPCAEAKDLLEWASQAVEKEQKQLPQEFDIDNGSKGYVKARHRDNSIANLLKLSNHFGFEPDTFSSAVILTDRFLGLVKVYPKYMQCVSMAGLLLAAKINEEEEFVPTISDFIKIGRCDCSAGDLMRMERLMVKKLDWDILSVTPVLFLHKFVQLFVALGIIRKKDRTSTLKRLVPSLLSMQCRKSVLKHTGSSLALGLLWYNIEHNDLDGSGDVVEVARLLGVSDHDFVHCIGVVSDFMEMLSANPCHVSRKRKRSAMFSPSLLPTIVEASTAAESESEDDSSDTEDSGTLQENPDITSERSLESVDKQNHLAFTLEQATNRPLYSTVVKSSSCGSAACTDLPSMFNGQALVF